MLAFWIAFAKAVPASVVFLIIFTPPIFGGVMAKTASAPVKVAARKSASLTDPIAAFEPSSSIAVFRSALLLITVTACPDFTN
ncbi:hypothetical protein D3C86_1911440 [compost metagenome]